MQQTRVAARCDIFESCDLGKKSEKYKTNLEKISINQGCSLSGGSISEQVGYLGQEQVQVFT